MCADERECNALLQAIRPGGILHSYTERSPAEVLCAPQQSFLDESGFSPYLRLPAVPSAYETANTPTSTAAHEVPLDGASGGEKEGENDGAVSFCPAGSTRMPVQLTLEQHRRVAAVLREQFLEYHLVHFDTVASTTFTTLRGQRGEFSHTLDSVSRYGRIGASRIVVDLEPFVPRTDASVPDGHPCKMHLYIITAPLMDEAELHNTMVALDRAMASPALERSPGECGRYSRDAVSHYRRTVTADNDVGFGEFQRMMEMPVCASLVRALSSFVESAQQCEAPLTDSRGVRRAAKYCAEQFARISRFARDGERQRIAAEGFEKYIMTKLYWRAFGAEAAERERGAQLDAKLQRLTDAVGAAQLDALPEVETDARWPRAMMEIDGMNFFKSPRDKLRCGVRACARVSECVAAAIAKRTGAATGGEGADDGKPTAAAVFGADEFLPCFMLLVVRAVPRNYLINVRYVATFRDAALSTAEENYCLANLESAVEFWLRYNESDAAAQDRAHGTHTPHNKEEIVAERGALPPISKTPNAEVTEPVKPTPQPPTAPLMDDLFPTAYPTERARADSILSESSCDWSVKVNSPADPCASPLQGNERRIDVVKVLVEENKAFETLTVAELRAIVEEARIWLLAKNI